MSKFLFIKDKNLQKNLDIIFDYIYELTVVAEKYKGILQCSFRKTIVIYTTSIIEALLLWILKKRTGDSKIVELREWKYFDMKIIYDFKGKPVRQVVSGYRKKKIKKLNNLDLFNINRLCKQYGLIDKKLFDKVDEVRLRRNRLHVGSLTEIEDEYSKKDLIFVSDVLEEVVRLVKDSG